MVHVFLGAGGKTVVAGAPAGVASVGGGQVCPHAGHSLVPSALQEIHHRAPLSPSVKLVIPP